ncbi:MAG TPA: ATP-dependent helicase C-terminal domain-containing protein [Vicinamibacterales bacterium]
MPLAPLPIDPHIPAILERVRERRALIIIAAPGAGKTTRVAPALAADGPVILLQPRRVAARSIARRIADERGWTVGREVGWHVRFERRFDRSTSVLLATEGILTARLQQDPFLSDFRTIVLDEFHERSIHADLGIALAKQAWLARDDLRVVVMSATMDAVPVSRYLGECPVIDVPGRTHPLTHAYRPGASLGPAVREALEVTSGQVLCFLPGAPEIRRARPEVQTAAGPGVEVLELHGSMEGSAQDAALADRAGRRVILATNIAETSLTVPGVTAVVDTGLHKVARYDPDRAIDSLETERISRDSADQRAGRAARLGPGLAVRLWAESDRLRPHREPDIHRIDLSGPLLDIVAWGGDPRSMEWFDPPSRDAIDAGLRLLERLDALDSRGLTTIGRDMQRVPLHPRLARILVASDGARPAALACALLAERHFVPSLHESTSSDLLSAIARERELPPHVTRVAAELSRSFDRAPATQTEEDFRRAILAGFPDRVARRRAPGSPRALLASGHGAVLAPESGVRDAEFLVALDVTAGRRGEGSEARIRIASAVDRDWLTPTARRVEHSCDASGTVRATARSYYDEIVLAEHPVQADPGEAAALIADAYLGRGLNEDDQRLLRRLAFAGLEVDLPSLVRDAAHGCRSLGEIDLPQALPWKVRTELDRLAPPEIVVPSGRAHRLEYEPDGSVSASVKLQELFGLADTPVVGPRREPVLLRLLAPNGRPVQMTRDLRSFWERTYPDVRKELRGRYPKHPWPEDPWSATPTARTTRGMKKA